MVYLAPFILKSVIRRLRQYLDLVEKSISEKKEDWIREVESHAAKMNEEEKDEYLEFQSDEHWAFTDDYPDLLRKSVFLSGFNLLEHRLLSLCKRLQKLKKIKLNINDVKGSGITKAQVYLKKVVGVSFPDSSKLWLDILVYQSIRNLIVHNDSDLKKDSDSDNIREFVSDKPGLLKLKHNSRIIFEKDFCLEALGTIEAFLLEVYAASEAIKGGMEQVKT